jgi:hypothetical protein
MKTLVCILLPVTIYFWSGWGCTSPKPVTAWEHLRIALELDEESVIEYIALEYLPAVVAYNPGNAVREGVFLDPSGSIGFIVSQYPEAALDQIMTYLPAGTIDKILLEHPNTVLERLASNIPTTLVETAVRIDPHLAFDRAFQRDPINFIRRAIDNDPRYAREYLNTYYEHIR